MDGARGSAGEGYNSSTRTRTSSLLVNGSCDGYKDEVNVSGVRTCGNCEFFVGVAGCGFLMVSLETMPEAKRWADTRNDNLFFVFLRGF